MLRDRLMARLAEMGAAPDYSRLVSEVLGIRGARPDLARRLFEQALVVEDRRQIWRRVGARVCMAAPAAPGVYVFRDAEGRALYVGKAVNLRRRLGAQFADRRWRALRPAVAQVAEVECRQVGSEIEALLREAILIRELQPIGNVQTGSPALRTRAIPRRLMRDVLILVPSVDVNCAELVGARVDGDVMFERAERSGADLSVVATRLLEFFSPRRDGSDLESERSLAPLVFSWLAGRGSHATRLDPHDTESAADLSARLTMLLNDKALFSERLVGI